MNRTLLTAILTMTVLGTFAIAGTSAEAARVRANIGFASTTSAATVQPQAGGSVSFAVSASVAKESDLYSLWVANKCFSGSTLISAEYMPVNSGVAGAFTVPASASSCTAYAWMFPNSEAPLRDASMSYSVAK